VQMNRIRVVYIPYVVLKALNSCFALRVAIVWDRHFQYASFCSSSERLESFTTFA
jgi:hypothetical protein